MNDLEIIGCGRFWVGKLNFDFLKCWVGKLNFDFKKCWVGKLQLFVFELGDGLKEDVALQHTLQSASSFHFPTEKCHVKMPYFRPYRSFSLWANCVVTLMVKRNVQRFQS